MKRTSIRYYTIIDFNEVDIRIYHRGQRQPKLKSITVLLYDFVFDFLCKISAFTFAINNTKMNG